MSTVGTRFYKIAQQLTARGIAISPTYPGERRAKFLDWTNQATTKMSKVDEWMNQGYLLKDGLHVVTPGHNWVCVAKRDGVGCLDIDDPAKCLALGMPPLPEGFFIVDTPGGGLHVPFVQTNETAALGNRNVFADGELIFEFKGHNTAWCAPWQQRQDGGYYKPKEGGRPLLNGLPTELITWIAAQSKTPAPKQAATEWGFHEDFDLAEFLEHNKSTEDKSYKENGSLWVATEECPLCGKRSGGSTGKAGKCKFIFGGRGYGFICHACSVSGREEFEQAMQVSDPDWEPWDGVMYAEEEALDMEQFADDESKESEKAVAAAPAKEKCHAGRGNGCLCGGEHVYPQSNLSAETRAAVDEALLDTEQPEPGDEPATADRVIFTAEMLEAALQPAARKKVWVEDGTPTLIPPDALYGQMAKWAHATELPLEIAYPAVLATYSALPKYDEILGVRFNLYCALLMPVGGGKNLALARAAEVLEMRDGLDYMDATIGGVGGLFHALGNKTEGRGKDKVEIPGPRKMLINPAEFAATMINMKIENSTLGTHFSNLWDKNHITLPVREGTRDINCRVSILGALPVDKNAPESFSRYFGEETAAGLYSRFLLGYSDTKLNHRWAERWKWSPPIPADIEDYVLPTTPPLGWTKEAEDYYDTLELPFDHDGRGLYNLKRVALLTATANRDSYVTLDCLKSAELFMLWQMRLKRFFRAGSAEKISHGELSSVIMDTLTRIDADGAYERSPVVKGRLNINLARVIHKYNWKKFGIEAVQRTVQSLTKSGQLQQGFRLDTRGKVVRSTHHVVVTRFER